MTAFARTDGKRVTTKFRNVGNVEQILILSEQKKPVTLESISICNTTGTTELTYALYVKSKGNSYYIRKNFPLPKWDSQGLPDHSVTLTDGESLAIIASATGVDVVAVFIESSSMQESGAPGSLNDWRPAALKG